MTLYHGRKADLLALLGNASDYGVDHYIFFAGNEMKKEKKTSAEYSYSRSWHTAIKRKCSTYTT